ncbi:MAG: replication protein [Syntrophomonadaceae bacterium]|nr:replication protein [Syntrophomonadaceae bacterium]
MPKGDREIFKADCEDGYTRIANLILEAIPLARLNGVQTGICLFLWRRSYGWNRDADAITLAEFAAACGTSKTYISRQLKDLMDKNIVHRREHKYGHIPVYAFTTCIAQWCKGCINVQGLHKNAILGLYNSATEGLHKTTTPNHPPDHEPPAFEPPLKTERKKIERNIYTPDSTELQLAEMLLLQIRSHIPGYKQPDLQKWSKTIDYLLRLDRREPDEVKEVIKYAQADPFWQANILSAEKLRQHYDRLNLRRSQSRASPGQGQSPLKKSKNDYPIYYCADIVSEVEE